MRKLFITLMVLISMMALNCFGSVDQNLPNIWHIRTDGNDSNEGHSFQTGLQTLSGAINNAAPGDIVYIWPGIYTGHVTLDPCSTYIGVGDGAIITWDTNLTANITLASYSTLKNLTILHTGTPASSNQCLALSSSNKTGFRIKNCRIISTGRGLSIVNNNTNALIELRDSQLDCGEYAVYVANTTTTTISTSFLMSNCIARTAGWSTCSSTGIFVYGNVNADIQNCTISSKGDVTDTQYMISGVDSYSTGATLKPNINITNCSIRSRATNNGICSYGVHNISDYGTINVSNCSIDANTYDLINNSTGSLNVNSSAYSKTSGTITIGCSGWARAEETIIDANVKAAIATADVLTQAQADNNFAITNAAITAAKIIIEDSNLNIITAVKDINITMDMNHPVVLSANGLDLLSKDDPNTDPNSWNFRDWLVFGFKSRWGNKTVLDRYNDWFYIYDSNGQVLVKQYAPTVDYNDFIYKVQSP